MLLNEGNIIVGGDLKRIFDEGVVGPYVVEFNEYSNLKIFNGNRNEPHHFPL
jgi:hypothetical protein